MKIKQNQQGFTIVELLIVIVVIGILAALVITTFTGIQQRARNTERETDIKAIHGQLEAYYAVQGSYPDLADLNTEAWRAANMRGLDSDALQDPRGTAQTLVAAPADNNYAYAVFQADGTTACDTDDDDCVVYTLTATYEGTVNGNTEYVKNNLN